MGEARLSGMVVRQRAAVLPEVRDRPDLRGGRLPRRRRPDTGPPILERRDAAGAAAILGDLRGLRIPRGAGPEPPGRRGGQSPSSEQRGRGSDEHEPDVPVDGPSPPEPDHPVRCTRSQDDVRRRPCRRRRGGERRRHMPGSMDGRSSCPAERSTRRSFSCCRG